MPRRGRGARAQPVEHATNLVGVHALLEVVEQDVVRIVGRGKALDVAMLDLESAVEPGAERGEVVVCACVRPGLDALGRELRHLGLELGGDASRFLPVAPGDGDQAGVVRVRVEVGLLGPEPLEQLADLVAHEELVREAVQRRKALGPRRGASGRHHHELIPFEHPGRDDQVLDLRQLTAKRGQGVRHGALIVDVTARVRGSARLGIEADAVDPLRVVGELEELRVAVGVAVGPEPAVSSPDAPSHSRTRRAFSGPRQLAPTRRPVSRPSAPRSRIVHTMPSAGRSSPSGTR